MTSTDYLEHHGTQGMKWGQRNGPPYPLTTWQQRAGNAVAIGREVLNDYARKAGAAIGKAANDYAIKAKADYDAKVAKRKAKAEDMENRKREAARREKLVKMAKKHPELLTDRELDELNNRKQKESNFEKNYNPKKKGNEEVKKIKDSLVRDVITPATIEVGKAAVASLIAGGDFETIARARVTKAIFSQNNNQNQGKQQNNNGQQGSGKKKPKKGNINLSGSGKKK